LGSNGSNFDPNRNHQTFYVYILQLGRLVAGRPKQGWVAQLVTIKAFIYLFLTSWATKLTAKQLFSKHFLGLKLYTKC